MWVTLTASVAREYDADGQAIEGGASFDTPIVRTNQRHLDIDLLFASPVARPIISCAMSCDRTMTIVSFKDETGGILSTLVCALSALSTTIRSSVPTDASECEIVVLFDHLNGFEFSSITRGDRYFIVFIPCSKSIAKTIANNLTLAAFCAGNVYSYIAMLYAVVSMRPEKNGNNSCDKSILLKSSSVRSNIDTLLATMGKDRSFLCSSTCWHLMRELIVRSLAGDASFKCSTTGASSEVDADVSEKAAIAASISSKILFPRQSISTDDTDRSSAEPVIVSRLSPSKRTLVPMSVAYVSASPVRASPAASASASASASVDVDSDSDSDTDSDSGSDTDSDSDSSTGEEPDDKSDSDSDMDDGAAAQVSPGEDEDDDVKVDLSEISDPEESGVPDAGHVSMVPLRSASALDSESESAPAAAAPAAPAAPAAQESDTESDTDSDDVAIP